MRKELERFVGRVTLTVGALGTLAGIALAFKEPEKIAGYVGAIASIGAIQDGYERIKKHS